MKKGEEAREYGAMIEERMRKMFKGKISHLDEVDFETSKCLYEIKSCRIFNKCYNGNDKRPYMKKQHKKIETLQLGRFQIITDNHIMLYLRQLQTGKIAKYVFAIRYGKQIMFRVLKWKELTINNTKDYQYISVKDIFG